MRMIELTVDNQPIGEALTWAYPDGGHLGLFKIKTYNLTVSGTNKRGEKETRNYEVLRFGIKSKGGSEPRVVGLADEQKHVIKRWLPYYSVRSAASVEVGAWQVYDNFLIHDGPDYPNKEVYASVGCVEICGAPRGFDQFNDFIISLSGSTKQSRDAKLADIGRSSKMLITYRKAQRPPLEKISN